MLITSADLENPGNPVVVRLLSRLSGVAWVPLAFDSRAVRDENQALAIIFYSVYYGDKVSVMIGGMAVMRRSYSQTKLLYRVMSRHLGEGWTW